MEQLIQEELLGEELFLVDTPNLVARYNECLGQLGLSPTTLERFRVDCMGWSPEIAEEKDMVFYLSAGLANPMVIIVSPDQANSPTCCPYNSYDKLLLCAYFERFKNEIADITRSRGLGIDIDQGLTRFNSLRDLLLVEYVVARSSAGELTDIALRQRKLVSKIQDRSLAWFDAELRQQIIESATLHGDLRYRRLYIPDMKFTDFCSFHTRAFGGVFVVRKQKGTKGLLVLEDKSQVSDVETCTLDVEHIKEPRLFSRLLGSGFITVDTEFYRRNAQLLEHKRECLLADVLCAEDPQLNYLSLNGTQKKQLAISYENKLPDVFHEIERVSKQFTSSWSPRIDVMSIELQQLLARPVAALPESEQALLWQLISRIEHTDVVQLYNADKSYFIERYREWPQSKKSWAVQTVKAHAAIQLNHKREGVEQ